MRDLMRFDYSEKELLYNQFMTPALWSAIASLSLAPASHGLDAGCGPGGMFHLLDKATAHTGSVTGLDISHGHLNSARQQVEQAGIAQRVQLLYADLEAPFPFRDDTFDWAWTADTLSSGYEEQAMENPVYTIQEMKRVTKPGGIIAAFFGNWLGTLLMPGYAHIEQSLLMAAEVRYRKRGSFHPSFHHENALSWMRVAGLENIRVSTHVVTYQSPLPEALIYYLQKYVFEEEYLEPEGLKAYLHQVGMTADEWETWRCLSNPDHPAYLLTRDDYFCIRYGTLTVGTVPHQD